MSPTSIGINLRVTGHCSQGGRKYMEDFFSVAYQQSENKKDLEYAFFGIYDGHGGSEAATFAKEHLMNAIVNQKLFWSDCDQDVLRAIREGYIATHYAMWPEQEKWPKTATGLPSTAGTTASVAFIRRGKIYIGHVGDSGIVLGYQEEGDKCWRAKPLTHDHKPECNVEKTRIINSGGKVVTKSGVPRVVWNRPKIGHKGPVRRSTPIDEIPFLAVARSLGDLWSYNSALNEFVVSPDPDVKVVKIDPKSFRCLIFGTDGLWNVLSSTDAVNITRDTEIINERLTYIAGGRKWSNPSKCLVDKALERWSSRKMRADNTSVVTIMLDPPGPPKRETIFRKSPTASYGLEYIQMDGLQEISNAGDFQNIFTNSLIPMQDDNGMTLYDQQEREKASADLIDKYAVPSSGYAVMTRCENNYDNYLYDENQSDVMSRTCSTAVFQSTSNAIVQSEIIPANSLSLDIQYMNSFAESYNSLLISSYENETGNGDVDIINDNNDDYSKVEVKESEKLSDYHSYHSLEETGLAGHDHVHHHHPNTYNQQQQHQYQQQCMSAEEGYSLTKLETRGEQQFNSIQSFRRQNVSFQEFGEENSYNQYDNVSSSYQQQSILSLNRAHSSDECVEDQTIVEEKAKSSTVQLITPQNVIYKYFNNGNFNEPNLELNKYNEKNWAESIQINEISSSVVEKSNTSSITESDESFNELPRNVAVTFKQKIDERYHCHKRKEKVSITNRSLPNRNKSYKTTSCRNKRNPKSFSSEQNENISVTDRRLLRSYVDNKQRTLRSRNFLSKDMKMKPSKQNNHQLRRGALGQSHAVYIKLRSRQLQQKQDSP